MDVTTTACGCVSREMLNDTVTVPAGSVNGGLSACGYEMQRDRLPDIHFRNQEYSEGFCPDTALMIGTLYPELVNVYK